MMQHSPSDHAQPVSPAPPHPAPDAPNTGDTARRHNTSTIGKPVQFATGPYAGRTVRAALVEVQQAELGRKCADPPRTAHAVPAAPGEEGRKPGRKDRRPLDPPPVVAVRLFSVSDEGTPTQYETEIPATEKDSGQLICHADLFPYHGPISMAYTSASPTPSASATSASSSYSAPAPELGRGNNAPYTAPYDPAATSPAINENSKMTTSLFGTSYAVAAYILDPRGRPVSYFVFPDLAVKVEGVFFLRYRVFDLVSLTGDSQDLPVLAECVGGPFRVYSTKAFPGLAASTPLTKHLARWGIRVNVREAVRTRTPKKKAVADGGEGSGSGRKRSAGDDDDDDEDY